jgi:hypothetical protein
MKTQLDKTKITDVEIDGIDPNDAPDYCDAYVASALYEYEEGKFRELTDDELEELSMDGSFVHEHVEDLMSNGMGWDEFEHDDYN